MNIPVLPTINALLNASAGIFLFLGWIAIKRKNRDQHRQMMLGAFFSSALFLVCYLYYHLTVAGLTRYQGRGLWKVFYLGILSTHSLLAAVIVPFILMALWYAFQSQFDKHARITRWLYPTWIYVSITGVMVYLMLYIFPA